MKRSFRAGLAAGVVTVAGLAGFASAAGPVDKPEAGKESAATPGRAATRQPLRIMCVGDSITVGYTDNPKWRVPFEFGYRAKLYSLLRDAGYDVQFVGRGEDPWNGRSGMPTNTPTLDLRPLGQDRHRGDAGRKTAGVANGIRDWIKEDNPDVILLMIGINDGGGAEACRILELIVERVVTTKPDADLVVAQITPKIKPLAEIDAYNAYIRDKLVPTYRAKGCRVSTVDQHRNMLEDGLIDPSRFSNGANHPDAVAYDRMAQTWFEAIKVLRPLATE